jgi:hypothetical protein
MASGSMKRTYKCNIHLSKLDFPLGRYDISNTEMIDCCVVTCLGEEENEKIRVVTFTHRYWRVLNSYKLESTTHG